MGSMNNWLAFSLSQQEFQQPQTHISGDDVSADCFGISSGASTGGLNIPNMRSDGSFGILEAFNRSQPQSQDWTMKNLDFKGSTSELSMVVGSTSHQNEIEVGKPKLEDFLGGNSFPDNDPSLQPGCNSMGGAAYDNSSAYMFSHCSLQLPSAASAVSISDATGPGGSNNSNSIGLSMIKTWLRSQPGPQQQDGKVPEMAIDGGGGSSLGRNGGNPSNVQSLSLSMSTGSQSSSALPLMTANPSGCAGAESPSSVDTNKQKNSGGSAVDVRSGGALEAETRKSIDTFGQRTSIYRGVTRHRWTGRYEAHLWDNSCRREGQTRKGRQVYLGGYDKEEKAARAYDLAALKYWGTTTTTNFPISNYEKEIEEMKHMTRQEYVASLRRKSSGFSRGASIYRGVTRHHQHGRWQARIGRVAGNKDLYLGTFSTQEEAAEAYDIAAIKFRGLNAVTNFDMSRYDVKSIIESSALPIGGAAKRLKEGIENNEASVEGRRNDDRLTSQLTDGISSYGAHHHGWSTIAFQQTTPPPLAIAYPFAQQRAWCKQEQETVTSLQDLHHLQLNTASQNFFQPSAFHNLMGMDSSPMEHSSGSSNSFVYNGFSVPLGAVSTDHSHHSQGLSGMGEGGEVKHLGGFENMLASTDPYSGRNIYYLSQQSPPSVPSNNWIPNSGQTIPQRPSSNIASLFSVWNDA